jgi:MFS family permease
MDIAGVKSVLCAAIMSDMRLFGRKLTLPRSRTVIGGSGTPAEGKVSDKSRSARKGRLEIPSVVKKNTVRLALSQAFVGSGTQMIPALGALVILQLTHSATLTGLGTSMMAISRFMVAYPAGKISDRFGRKPALAIGLALGIFGAPMIGLSVVRDSFPLLVAGFLVFGLGIGMVQQLRVAAADMYPPSHRGQGTGYVLMGSLIGAILAPGLIAFAQHLSPALGIDPLGLPWLFIPAMIVPALFLVFSLSPDPQQIAKNLDKYYPGHQSSPKTAQGTQSKISLRALLSYYPTLSAIIASLAVQGNMNMIMFITSLALQEHGHPLPAISISVSIHVIGMFGFTVPIGWLADKLGRRVVMLAGAVMAGVGSLLVPTSPLYFVITLGTFLVGLGWSAVYVAATALIADSSSPEIRGRAIGINDTFSYIPGIVLPLVAGPMAAAWSLSAVGLLGMFLMVPPLMFLLLLREPSPGKYLSRAKIWRYNKSGNSS